MKQLSIGLVAVALALGMAACGKDKDKGADKADPASCDAVAAKVGDMVGRQVRSTLPPDKKDIAEQAQAKLQAALLAVCKEDAWPEEVRKCIVEAGDDQALDECGEKGGQEFQDRVKERMAPAMGELMRTVRNAVDGDDGQAPANE